MLPSFVYLDSAPSLTTHTYTLLNLILIVRSKQNNHTHQLESERNSSRSSSHPDQRCSLVCSDEAQRFLKPHLDPNCLQSSNCAFIKESAKRLFNHYLRFWSLCSVSWKNVGFCLRKTCMFSVLERCASCDPDLYVFSFLEMWVFCGLEICVFTALDMFVSCGLETWRVCLLL